jgi:hypothetical protein
MNQKLENLIEETSRNAPASEAANLDKETIEQRASQLAEVGSRRTKDEPLAKVVQTVRHLSNNVPEISSGAVTPRFNVRTICFSVAYKSEEPVPTSTRPKSIRRRGPRQSHVTSRATRIGKVRKAFWLDPRLLAEARASLGASSEREAIEMALDLVRFRSELLRGTRALLGLELSRID